MQSGYAPARSGVPVACALCPGLVTHRWAGAQRHRSALSGDQHVSDATLPPNKMKAGTRFNELTSPGIILIAGYRLLQPSPEALKIVSHATKRRASAQDD